MKGFRNRGMKVRDEGGTKRNSYGHKYVMMTVAGQEVREKLCFVGLSEEWIMNSCVRYWAERCSLTVEVRLHLAAVKFEGTCLYCGQFCCSI